VPCYNYYPKLHLKYYRLIENNSLLEFFLSLTRFKTFSCFNHYFYIFWFNGSIYMLGWTACIFDRTSKKVFILTYVINKLFVFFLHNIAKHATVSSGIKSRFENKFHIRIVSFKNFIIYIFAIDFGIFI